jgi:hypothetical protein
MKKQLTYALPGLLFGLLCWGCQPEPLEYISDYDVVYTNHDAAYPFASVGTYFLPDSVVHNTAQGQTADHRYDNDILAAVKRNLDALGWRQLAPNGSQKADVVVLVTASRQAYNNCASYCWYCDWGWYPGWGFYPPAWGPGWGWGPPAGIVCSSFSTGSVFVGITEPDEVRSQTLPVVWIGTLNGLLEGSESSIRSRISTNIDQMFVQSPYLKD